MLSIKSMNIYPEGKFSNLPSDLLPQWSTIWANCRLQSPLENDGPRAVDSEEDSLQKYLEAGKLPKWWMTWNSQRHLHHLHHLCIHFGIWKCVHLYWLSLRILVVDQNDNRLPVWPDTHLVCLPLGTPEIQRNIVTGPCTKAIELQCREGLGEQSECLVLNHFYVHVFYIVYVYFQCRTIYKNFARTLLQLQIYQNKLNLVIELFLTKLLFGLFTNPAPWATWCHQYFGKYSRSPGSKVTSKGFRWAKRSNPQINRRCLHCMTRDADDFT